MVGVIGRLRVIACRCGSPNRIDSNKLSIRIAVYGGDARESVKSLIVANHFLETDLERLRAAVSTGYARENCLRQPRRCRATAKIGMIEVDIARSARVSSS
jgi:hypothetical protein